MRYHDGCLRQVRRATKQSRELGLANLACGVRRKETAKVWTGALSASAALCAQAVVPAQQSSAARHISASTMSGLLGQAVNPWTLRQTAPRCLCSHWLASGRRLQPVARRWRPVYAVDASSEAAAEPTSTLQGRMSFGSQPGQLLQRVPRRQLPRAAKTSALTRRAPLAPAAQKRRRRVKQQRARRV